MLFRVRQRHLLDINRLFSETVGEGREKYQNPSGDLNIEGGKKKRFLRVFSICQLNLKYLSHTFVVFTREINYNSLEKSITFLFGVVYQLTQEYNI